MLREQSRRRLLYHHCRGLAHVQFGVVEPIRLTELLPTPDCFRTGTCDWRDEWHDALNLEASYRWLADRAGFWPLFLAVGETDEDRQMTYYQRQFSRRLHSGPRNKVLFSFTSVQDDPVFTDFVNWHIILNAVTENGDDPHQLHVQLNRSRDEASVLRPSWSRSRWLAYARSHPADVQGAVPRLDLSQAEEIWAPSRRVADRLAELGFDRDRVLVRRLACVFP